MCKRLIMGLLCLAVVSTAAGHSLSPSRLYAPSGSELIGYTMRAINAYEVPASYSVECYQHELGNPIACSAIPGQFRLRPGSYRNFRFRLDTGGEDGMYLICTVYDPSSDDGAASSIKTRVCAKFGVGVDPETGDPR